MVWTRGSGNAALPAADVVVGNSVKITRRFADRGVGGTGENTGMNCGAPSTSFALRSWRA